MGGEAQRMAESATDQPQAFGEALRRHRVAAGLTQQELAERAGLSVRGLSDLEAGRRRSPYRDTLLRLVDALELGGSEREALLALSHRQRAGTHAATGLPVPLTTFVGRGRELAEVRHVLGTARLVTLTGTGGIGKTRLAIEAARASAEAVFVDLAPLADGRLVAAAVAAALGVREQPNVPLQEQLSAFLAPRLMLLVLDNCEHLVGACAPLAEHLLRACPGLHILATSREPLGVAGEQLWPVPPLALPGPAESQLSASDAVQLFVQRARLVQPAFELNPRNAPVVAEVCRRLDGLPLALELAAARVNILSVDQIAERLDHRLRLLTAASRNVPLRHHTLRAAIDWSYDLLAEPERVLLRRVSVFAGGLTLRAAEAVCAANSIEQRDVLDLLSGLIDKSLVLAEHGAGDRDHARYWMLETVREYAAERLFEAGEVPMLRRRHLTWALALAEQTPRWTSAQVVRLATEHDNLRAALRSAVDEARAVGEADTRADRGAADTGLHLAACLWAFWFTRGHYAEGSAWLAELLRLPHASRPGPARVAALAAAGHLAFLQSRYDEARTCLDQSLAFAEQLGDQLAIARALHFQGMLALMSDELDRARTLATQSLAINRQLGKRRRQLFNLLLLGRIDLAAGDAAGAARHAEESLPLARSLEDSYGVALSLENLGRAAARSGESARARPLFEEALTLARELEHLQSIGGLLLALGQLCIDQGEPMHAHRLLIEALTVAHDAGEMYYIADALEGLAGVAEPERAAQLGGAATAIRERLGVPRLIMDHDLVGRWLSASQKVLGESSYAAAWQAGRCLALDKAVQYALETPPPCTLA